MSTTKDVNEDNCERIHDIILNDWMFGYKGKYQLSDYDSLLETIKEFKKKKLQLKFFLPGFPCKSGNVKDKVFGTRTDYAEYQAVRNILTTVKKISADYEYGADFTIMSDYHTFDKYIGITEENYQTYHESLRGIINELAAEEYIKLISLKKYEIFKRTPENKLSEELFNKFGDKKFKDEFDEKLETDENFLERFTEMKKFMLKDQSWRLPDTEESEAATYFVEGIVRGMMNQGVALSTFLKTNNLDTIRMSIHDHNPIKGTFSMDLFKQTCSGLTTPTTPWHNVVCFDAREGKHIVAHKDSFESQQIDNTSMLKVQYKGDAWFYVLIGVCNGHQWQNLQTDLEVSIRKGGTEIMIESKVCGMNVSVLEASSIFNILKEFGMVIFRGFSAIYSTSLEYDLALVDHERAVAENKLSIWQDEFHTVECFHVSEDNVSDMKNRFARA